MKSFLLVIIAMCSILRGVSAQVIDQPPEEEASLSHDTALANHYLKKANPLVLDATRLDTALYYLKKASYLSQKHAYKKGLSEYYRLLAITYNTRYLYDSALWAAEKEFYWSRQTGDPSARIESYASKGIIYEHEDELDSAVKYYLRALHVSDSVGNKKMSGMLDNNLSILFHSIGDYQNGLMYARSGYRIGTALRDTLILANCLFNLAGNENDLARYDTAITLYKQVKEIAEASAQYGYMIPNVQIMLANIFSDQGNNRKSVAIFRDLLQHGEQLTPYVKIYAYENLGNTLYLMKRYAEADKNIGEALQIAKQIGARNEIKNNYRDLADVKEAEKQYVAALLYRKKYDSLRDTLMSEATKKNIHLLEVKYHTAQKNKQIAQQNLELFNRQRAIERKNTWILLIIAGLIALTVIFILSWRGYRHKRNLHRQSMLTIQKEHEVNTLKAKMEAREEERVRIGREMHDDVGSALTTILYLSDDLKTQAPQGGKNTADKIASTAGAVVDKMNEIIWSMNRDYDTLDDLIAYTRQHAADFLDNYGLEYHFDAPDPVPDIRLQGEQRRNIYLVIKETLHNIVKHARASEVHMTFCLQDTLGIIIHDNGGGIEKDKLRRFGNGLRNMKQRMESVGGSFEITAENGTTVKIHCPLDQAPQKA